MYRTTFDLTGLDPTTAVLWGRWAMDNQAELRLNGISVAFVRRLDDLKYFTIKGGFVAGINTLDVVNINESTSANPGGVRLEISGTALPAN